jgi:hypothetical protein
LLGASACGKTGLAPRAAEPASPLFYEVEGLKWGMTPTEVLKAWGPGEEGEAYRYANKGGYARAHLGYRRLPASDVVHTDLPPGADPDRPVEFLTWVSFESDEVLAKEEVRAELVSRFGQPLTDPKVVRNVSISFCDSSRCDVFRAAECTLATASWTSASAEFNRPAALSSLMYELAPSGLIGHVPRSDWPSLNGPVALSFPPELEAKVGALRRGVDGAREKDVEALLGRPNLRRGEVDGNETHYYLFVDGSLRGLEFSKGKLHAGWGLTSR